MPQIALAQLNFFVGDLAGNADKIIRAAARARSEGAELIAFSEMCVTGYPPEDLLLRGDFLDAAARSVETIASACDGIAVVVGAPLRDGGRLYNAAHVLSGGRVAARYKKMRLPNYGVFDERRYFSPGREPLVFAAAGRRWGLTICEDLWDAAPSRLAKARGAQALLNLSASPFHLDKQAERDAVLRDRRRETGLPVFYANQVGGQDELVFDGGSCVLDAAGEAALLAPPFAEDLYFCALGDDGRIACDAGAAAPLERVELMRRALVVGTRDYFRKNGFADAIVGVSGGIDSAVALLVAADALGAEHVAAVAMPSRYTAPESGEDARALCRAAGVELREISIEPAFEAVLASLAPAFAGAPADTTEENIQARLRGVLLMALANKFGKMLISTSNKSETAVGYTTLYGDMAGGFAPLKDVAKTRVYELARRYNRDAERIPPRIIDRPPTAELRPDQRDEDSLPPYAELDQILAAFVEDNDSCDAIVARGFPCAREVAAMVLKNEHKRRQGPPGVRITPLAFGKDRRYPVASGFRADE